MPALFLEGEVHHVAYVSFGSEVASSSVRWPGPFPATRLKAAGTGPLAPMAPNETEEGRAKNRRVELVKQ